MKFWKLFSRGLACAVCGIVVFAGSGQAATVDRIVAKVNKEIITLSELEERALFRIMSLRQRKVQSLPARDKVMAEELERMIEEKLLVDAAEKLNLHVSEERVTKAIDDIKRDNGLSDDDLGKMLEAEFKTMDDYKRKIRSQILMSQVINFEVRKRVVISDDDIERYYSQHQKDFWITEKLKLRHILFLLEEGLPEADIQVKWQKAQEALKKIRSGEKFEAVAKKYSEDVSASTGGELGEIERGKMVPEFEKAAFGLKEGGVSGLVKTAYGWHIIKVDRVIPGETVPLDKVKIQITNKLRSDKMQSVTHAYLQELRDKAFVEIKMSLPAQSKAQEVKHTESNSEDSPSSGAKGELTDLASAPQRVAPHPKISRDQVFPRFRNFEEELRYYKDLRDNEKITEREYREKKEALLNRL